MELKSFYSKIKVQIYLIKSKSITTIPAIPLSEVE